MRQTPQKAVGAVQQRWTPLPISTGHRRLHKTRNPQQPTTGMEAKSRGWWPPFSRGQAICGSPNAFIPPLNNKALGKHAAGQTSSALRGRRREKGEINANSRTKVTKGCFSSSITALLFIEHLDMVWLATPLCNRTTQSLKVNFAPVKAEAARGGRVLFLHWEVKCRQVPSGLIVDKLNYFWEVAFIIKIVQPYR